MVASARRKSRRTQPICFSNGRNNGGSLLTAQLAKKFIELAESPEVQADGIIKQFNWYPGIDPQYVQPKLDQAAWNKLFTDISPADLSKYGRPFPLSPYFKDIVEGYERVVLK